MTIETLGDIECAVVHISLAFDHFGLFGVPQHAANPVRLAGAAFLVLGVTLVRFRLTMLPPQVRGID